MTTQYIPYGAIGFPIYINFKKEDGTAFPLSGATCTLLLRKFSGETATKTLTILDEASGTTKYLTVSGDIDEVGEWRVQGRAVVSGGSGFDWPSEEGRLVVFRRIGA